VPLEPCISSSWLHRKVHFAIMQAHKQNEISQTR
jgi:hypothetical protein